MHYRVEAFDLQLRSTLPKGVIEIVDSDTPEGAMEKARLTYPDAAYLVASPFTETDAAHVA